MSDVSNALLQQHCDGMFFSILLLVFSAIKGPVKERRLSLSFMLGEKYVNKIFLLFSGSQRMLKCHQTKCSNFVNYRSK